MKTACDKVNQRFSAVVAVLKSAEIFEYLMKPQLKAEEKPANRKTCFSEQGVKEDPSETNDRNIVTTNEEVIEILDLIGVKREIKNIRRLGKFHKEKRQDLCLPIITKHRSELAPWVSHG